MAARLFTKSEIEDIISGIAFNHGFSAINAQNLENVCSDISKQLSTMTFIPASYDKTKADIITYACRNTIPYGTPVGFITSQCIEKFTQGTLNLFHSAGQTDKETSGGEVKMKELMNNSATPKCISYTLYGIDDKLDVGRDVNTMKLITEVDVFSDKNLKSVKDEIFEYIPTDGLYFSIYSEDVVHNANYVIRLVLDKSALFADKVFPYEIADAIESEYNYISCVYTDISIGIIYALIKRKGRTLNLTNDIKEFVVPKLKNIHVKGDIGLTSLFKKDGYYEGNGASMLDLINIPWSDMTKTCNDHVKDVAEWLGIEAARSMIYDEMYKLLGADSGNVNPMHIQLIADSITMSGELQPISRHGIDKNVVGPLGKISFEEPIPNLIKAAIAGKSDDIKSNASSIFVGKAPAVGTGCVKLRMKIKR